MHVSFSRVKTWRRCHAAHDYKYNQGLQRKRRSIPLLRGTILGEMLDARAMAQNGSRLKPMDVLEKYRKKYRVLFKEEQEKYGDIIGDIKRIYEGYERKYADDPWTYLKTEHLLTIDLTKDICFIGYADKVVQDREGRMWIVDHKAYRSIPSDEDRFSDLQSVFYIWAYGIQHPKDPIMGFCWDYLRTKPPTIPEPLARGGLSVAKNLDTDYDTYMEAIKKHNLDPADYKETLERLKRETATRFYRRVYLPSPPKVLIDNAVADMRSTAIEIKNLGDTLRDRNMSRDCKQCEYFNLCQAEYRGLDADFIRKTEYEEKPPHEEEMVNETE